jgi:FkbM family methyltransferase
MQIIQSGAKFRDKLILVNYFLSWPLRRIFRRNLLTGKVILKTKDGLFYCDDEFSAVSDVQPSFEGDLRDYFLNIREGVFLDVGASVGKYTILVGRRIKGKVISIEPNTKNFNILKKSIALNGLDNVTLVNSPCFSKEEEMDFFEGEGVGMHSFYKTKLTNPKRSIRIHSRKLDSILLESLNKEELKKVSFIKIDAEGAEHEILKGSKEVLKKSHPKILIEIWDSNNLAKVNEILSDLKYSCKKLNEENYLFE